jgi:hypothetical protein
MLRVYLQCLCSLNAAYMFEVCVKCALMLIVCSVCAEVRYKFNCIFIFSLMIISNIVEYW